MTSGRRQAGKTRLSVRMALPAFSASVDHSEEDLTAAQAKHSKLSGLFHSRRPKQARPGAGSSCGAGSGISRDQLPAVQNLLSQTLARDLHFWNTLLLLEVLDGLGYLSWAVSELALRGATDEMSRLFLTFPSLAPRARAVLRDLAEGSVALLHYVICRSERQLALNFCVKVCYLIFSCSVFFSLAFPVLRFRAPFSWALFYYSPSSGTPSSVLSFPVCRFSSAISISDVLLCEILYRIDV